MKITRKMVLVLSSVAMVLLLGGVVGAILLAQASTRSAREQKHSAPPEPPGDTDDVMQSAVTVKTVRPKLNPGDFTRSVTQPAYVEGFYQAELMARVAGPVKWIEKNIGDPVKQNEVLVELDVPDLVQDLAQKDALVGQAEQDVRAAEANVNVVAAGEKTALATQHLRESSYRRFEQLVKEKGATPIILDEELRNLEASRANLEEAKARSAAARVDVDVKKSRLAVAQAERDKAQAMVDFAKVKAPFDGTIVVRNVDPGAFVQNASTGHPTSLLTVVRTDIVTINMWVPEKDARYVNKGTEAILRMDSLGDQEIRAKVTRLSNWLDPNKSRDMRVEIDLPNPQETSQNPGTKETATKTGLLKPGMYGTMTLLLNNYDKAFLVPTSAILQRQGKTFMFEVRDGTAHLVRVRVQFEDGIRAKVLKRVQRVDPASKREVKLFEELDGTEEIIRSGQGELADGQEVKATQVEW